jgi:NAD(P)-dependent dehydrogenase (short-subunit alcohol dehydrogenase family)
MKSDFTKKFRGQVAIVTGAGGGMGRACGMAFVREGAATVLVDVDKKNVPEAVDQALGEGGESSWDYM